MNIRHAVDRPSASKPRLFQGADILGLKKRGQRLRSWISVDASGNSQIIEVDKLAMMRRCHLPGRDLRLLDPLLLYPSVILGREKAIVVSLEQIRCIITADEVLLLNSSGSYVSQYVEELQRRLTTVGPGNVLQSDGSRNNLGNTSPDYLPFEFKALEVALEAACTFLDSETSQLEYAGYPLLDELTSNITTLNLERVRQLKSRLVALTSRVQKVRDGIEQLMDDNGDMDEMYLTRKKRLIGGDQSLMGFRPNDGVQSISSPVSPVSSPPDSPRLRRHDSTESIVELEMLLEAYFVVIDSTLNKLKTLREYVDDSEDYINIQLDNVRNRLIRVELLLATGTFVVAIFGLVAAVFGMNFPIQMFHDPHAFKWVLIITGICGMFIFSAFVWFFKYRRLIPL